MSRGFVYNISGVIEMMAYILLGISCVLGSLNTLLIKKFQMGFKRDTIHFVMYNFVGAVIGSIYFFIASGFKIEMNGITLVYSFIYAAVVFLSLVLSICILSKISISLTSITSNAGAIISASVGGMIFFGEQMTLQHIFSVILILAAVVIPYRKLVKTGFKKESIWICIIYFFYVGIGGIIPKFYTRTEGVCNTVSWFFMTNLILVVVCGIFAGIFALKKHEKIGKILCTLTPGQFGNLAVRTAMSNICSVLQVVILTTMAISVYSVVNSSIGLVLSAIVSGVIFKEPLPKENKLGVALAVSAVVVSAL